MRYEAIVDDVEKEQWEQYAKEFADYSIYQTWAYQQVRAEMEGQELSRIVIKDKNGKVMTMCHVRIKRVVPLGLRIGYVQWGPLMRGLDGKLRCTKKALDMLREAYMRTKVNILRVVPNVWDNEVGHESARLLQASGFYRVPSVQRYHTVLLALDCSEEVLRARLHQTWRRKLRKVENLCIEVSRSTDEGLFRVLDKLYRGMLRRKKFKGLGVEVFLKTQGMLSAAEKMSVTTAYYDGEPATIHVTSNLGEMGILLLVASTEKGLVCRSSYLTWWRAITASRGAGLRYYDVGGIDPKKNPGVYQFKSGMGGQEASSIGAFDACSNMRVKIIWRIAERLYNLIKR